MSDPGLKDLNRAERLSLVDLFAGLNEEQLSTPSLCSAWTVRDVLAHLASPKLVSNSDIARQLLRKPSFSAATVAWSQQVAQHSFEEQLDALRSTAEDPFVPPLAGLAAPLTDAIIHGEDVRVPLGIGRDVPAGALRATLDFGVSWRATPAFVPFRRFRGLRFHATDIDWTAGSGAPLEGPAQHLALAIYGRIDAATDLTGEGVTILRSRCVQ